MAESLQETVSHNGKETTDKKPASAKAGPPSQGWLSGPNSFILRLNKLFSTTAGLDTSLATLNYTLILTAYLQSRSLTYTSTPTQPSSLPAYALANFLSEFRTTLRLTYLIPLLAQLQSLLSTRALPSPTHPDPLNIALTLLTTTTYILYQLTENIAHLADHRLFLDALSTLFPPDYILTQTPGTSDLWFLSNRLWHAGVSLDLIRAARALWYARSQSTTTPSSSSSSHRTDLLIASCWWPLTMHWSLQAGVWGVDDLAIGMLGTLANLAVLQGLWAATLTPEEDRKKDRVIKAD